MTDKTLPKIIAVTTAAKSRLFHIEQVQLQFSNGVERYYERLRSGRRGAVLIVPVTEQQQFILVKEYAVGTESYQWMFPKGLLEAEESVAEGANRELMEEIHFGAKALQTLHCLSTAPGYLTHQIHVVLAQQLYAQSLQGDEPEPLHVGFFEADEIEQMIMRQEITEARSIAAFYIAKAHLQ